MLISLYIKDFGLIEQAEITFDNGLNVLSGETGAGKSIILEALKAALGGRAQTEMIKTGCARAVVQATLDCTKLDQVQAKMQQNGLEDEASEGCLLIMSRELSRQGRHICRINGRIVNLGLYREIAATCVDLHGQHDQQSLLLPEKQLALLDSFGGADVLHLRKETERVYGQWQSYVRRRQEAISGSRERQQRIDMMIYQRQEIDTAGLAEEDEQGLRDRRSILANAERIRLLIEQILDRIYTGSGHQQAAVDLLGQAREDLEELCRYLPVARTWMDNIYSALCLVEDAGRDLASQRGDVETNPQELDYIEERLSVIERLKRKYGDSIPEILSYRDDLVRELEELEREETDASALDELVARHHQAYHDLADRLGEKRIAVAQNLSATVVGELRELAMNDVQFSVAVVDASPGPTGKNKIEFLISPNVGEPLKPLAKIASGGELSRILLAIKSTLAGEDDICTLVFDEVDAGTGGRTLQAVAEKLAKLARQKQVICVTHAAAVAAYASTHYLIEKYTDINQTVTAVHRLDGEERIQEISRMLGGDVDSRNLVQYVRKIMKN